MKRMRSTPEDEEVEKSKKVKEEAISEFLRFLKKNGLDSKEFSTNTKGLPRYVRVNPFGDEKNAAEMLSSIKDCKKIDWLPGCDVYAIPGTITISSMESYKTGDIYGIDAASCAAVLALNPKSGDHVLDLCTSPGAKFCTIADLMKRTGSVTGVDISLSRLHVTTKMLKKYRQVETSSDRKWRCRLFESDGQTFDVRPNEDDPDAHFDSKIFAQLDEKFRKLVNLNKSLRGRLKKLREKMRSRLSSTPAMNKNTSPRILYDRVLVDAECSHDGSIRHIEKFQDWGWSTFSEKVMNPERLKSLPALQRGLLENGFRLLKVGGTLVYSTCSLTRSQNEDVVSWFLEKYSPSKVKLVPVPVLESSAPCCSGSIKHTYRFSAMTSRTSGLFVATFVKLA